MDPVSVACPAKVNLYLRILAREDTGYHQIETLFQRIELADTVQVSHAPTGVELACVDAAGRVRTDFGSPEDNTVHRAAVAFLARAGVSGGLSIRLTKRIPAGTGLGGASSDAAGALEAANRLYGEPLGPVELMDIGGSIGADVPFFSSGAALAWAWGRGDRLLPLPPLPVAPVVLVVPEVRISTVKAYRALSETLELPVGPRALPGPGPLSWGDVSALQSNDFEAVTFPEQGDLAAVLQVLTDHGARVARMTGSGSALFGVFTDGEEAERAAQAVGDAPGVGQVHVTRTAGPGASDA